MIEQRLPVDAGHAHVITGAHSIIYSPDADGVRALLPRCARAAVGRRGRRLADLRAPAGRGRRPPHRRRRAPRAVSDVRRHPRHRGGARGKGVEFSRPIAEERWGSVTAIVLPGGGELGLYEPKHPQSRRTERQQRRSRSPRSCAAARSGWPTAVRVLGQRPRDPRPTARIRPRSSVMERSTAPFPCVTGAPCKPGAHSVRPAS